MYKHNITNFSKKLSFLIISFLANCAILLGLNYLQANLNLENKYGMSNKVMSFAVVDSTLLDLSCLLEYNDIKVIAETSNQSIIGVYDPSYFYYINANKIISPKEFRYFSSEDYISKANVSIYIENLSKVLDNSSSFNILEKNKRYSTEIINILDKDSEIYSDKVKIVKNLFSLKDTSIEKIYIDTNNSISNELLLKNRLSKMGLRPIKSEKTNVIKDIKSILTKGSRYDISIFFSVISIFTILIITFVEYAKSQNRLFYTSLICGASFKDFLVYSFKVIIIRLLMIILLSMLLTIKYIDSLNSLFLDLYMIMITEVNIIIVFLIIFIVHFAIRYSKYLREIKHEV